MTPLEVAILLLVSAAGTAVVLARDVLRQVLLNGLFGMLLVVLFLVFQAPDVALSELVVATVAFPLILLVACDRVARRSRR
jgi:energy-converting hydrogenase B subunit D